MAVITVLLAEDHAIVRKGLRSLLDDEPGIEVIGEAMDGREALAQAEALCPNVVVMDIAMPLLNGLEATRQIVQRCGGVRVLILSMYADREYVLGTLRAGAAGYIIKRAAPAELNAAIRAVYRGDTYLSPSISSTLVDAYVGAAERLDTPGGYDQLTSREREVLQLVAEGHSTRAIAEILHVSVKTAETHRANLRRKLDLHSTAELTQYAIRKGLIQLDP